MPANIEASHIETGLKVNATPRLQVSRSCTLHRLGRMKYADALELQSNLVARRKRNEPTDALVLLEHEPVITCGRNSNAANLLSSPEVLAKEGIDLVHTNRGGDVTFHGPGQLVAYPILALDRIRKDVVWYVRTLEEVIIRTLADLDVRSFRKPGMTGVWVDLALVPAKIAAIGVHISRWVTSHGLALNIDNDLRYYRHIVPCGIASHPVTSLKEILGRTVERRTVEDNLIRRFSECFGLEILERSSQDKFIATIETIQEGAPPCRQPMC